MKDEHISRLVKELEDLNIRERELLVRREAVTEELWTARAEYQRRSNRVRTGRTGSESLEICVNDRVKITNKVSLPPDSRRPVTQNDRCGKVTSVTGDRIYLTTDSGVKTWRLRKNVIILEE